MAGELSSQLSSDTKLLFHFSLASASENSGLRASDFDDGFVFDMDPNLLVDLDKLIIGHMIGEGSHSIVYKGWYESHPVDIKVMLPERTMYATPECKAKFQREVNLISRVKHKNIVKFIGALVEPSMMIITELLEGGSLQKILKSIYPMTLDLELSTIIALDISQVMEYLHANGIIHLDLKPDNLHFTDDKMHVKLTDFGIAREELCGETTCEAGSYRYMAPELFSKDPLPKGAKKCYDRKADVYSFAIVLWSLIKNQIPFQGRIELMAAYATAKNMRPSVYRFPEDLLPLLQSCWSEDPEDRPEFKEITKTLTKILQNCCTTRIAHAIASVNEIIEEEDHDLNNEEECANAQAPSQQSAETISKQNHETAKSIGYTERQSPKQNHAILKYSMLKCLLPRLRR